MTSDTPSREKLVVTGAAGRIGRLLLPVWSSGTTSMPWTSSAGEEGGVPIRALDTRDAAALREALAGCGSVLHLAATHLGHQGRMSAEDYLQSTVETNLTGVIRLFEAAAEFKLRRVVFMSSLTVHFGEPMCTHVGADDALRPHSLYACTKVFGEQLAAMHHRRDGLSSICIRLGQPYPTEGSCEVQHLADPLDRGCCVSEPDIVAGVLAALATTVPLATFPLVSACDPPLFDLTVARRVGYVPTTLLTPEGAVDSATDRTAAHLMNALKSPDQKLLIVDPALSVDRRRCKSRAG